MLLLERPLVNPGRFQQTLSGVRALEAVLIVLEELAIPYEYVDSKAWQKELITTGCKGEALKTASISVATRLFPTVDLDGFKDADGLLMAEYCRRRHK